LIGPLAAGLAAGLPEPAALLEALPEAGAAGLLAAAGAEPPPDAELTALPAEAGAALALAAGLDAAGLLAGALAAAGALEVAGAAPPPQPASAATMNNMPVPGSHDSLIFSPPTV